MKINGVELDFALFDQDRAAQRDAYFAVLKDIVKMDEHRSENQTEQIKAECDAIKHLFDDTFGEGTGDRVCGQGHDHLACLEAYEMLVNEQIRQCNRYAAVKKRLNSRNRKKK